MAWFSAIDGSVAMDAYLGPPGGRVHEMNPARRGWTPPVKARPAIDLKAPTQIGAADPTPPTPTPYPRPLVGAHA